MKITKPIIKIAHPERAPAIPTQPGNSRNRLQFLVRWGSQQRKRNRGNLEAIELRRGTSGPLFVSIGSGRYFDTPGPSNAPHRPARALETAFWKDYSNQMATMARTLGKTAPF